MKTSLQLNLGQHLTLTPQLQQAIRLLQLSTAELDQEVQNAIEENPMLEMDQKSFEAPKATSKDNTNQEVEPAHTEPFPNHNPAKSSQDGPNLDQFAANSATLQDHLKWQLRLSPFTELDQAIAEQIIDAIDDNGFLTLSCQDICESIQTEFLEQHIELEDIETVLYRIQRFDPIGVGARDLSECLMRQLEQLPDSTPFKSKACHLVRNYLDILGHRDYRTLQRKTKLSREELQQTIQLIQTLNPKPGSTIACNDTQYITPDLIVRKINNRWHVELNPESLPRVRINQRYAALIKEVPGAPDASYLKQHLQEARWLIKSLQSRHDTLLRVASVIVQLQQDFLEFGEEAMKPLVLNDIAARLELHESTVSRATTQKYIHTPRGVFELKYFFSSHVSTESGGNASATAIRAVIKKLIANEIGKKPLSDNAIAHTLQGQGINVARRTVAKYRESLHIPPSHERKTLS